DGVMVARGDLGVELDYASVPVAQKLISRKCQAAHKTCIIATEMMESMILSPRPTRAEVSDVANAVFDHADAVMLSGESAIGRHPVESVKAMRRVIGSAEEFLHEYGLATGLRAEEPLPAATLAAAVRRIEQMQSTKAVIVYTASGFGARILSKSRLRSPVLALSHDPRTVRRCCLYYGVSAMLAPEPADLSEAVGLCLARSREAGLAGSGDSVVVVAAHPIGSPGSTKVLVLETLK
ncbi:MAG TPA: pyruvate kinase, partial [Bryobacteraceae bacterium]|nr:pyruvate kinase [Bryobacteraceae bacterium]